MLAEICDFIHNYFELDTVHGTFHISGGSIELPFLLDGQRFRIRGSALNDGIYTYYSSGRIFDADDNDGIQLLTEQFTGSVDAMGVPRAVLDLSAEIDTWVANNAKALESPYTSESFGGYSYTKATGAGTGANASGMLTWQDMFKSRLKAYRKIA